MGLADEVTPVTRNPCVSCGIESTQMLNVPFPGDVEEFRQPGFAAHCAHTAHWWWCATFTKYGGTLPDRRRSQ